MASAVPAALRLQLRLIEKQASEADGRLACAWRSGARTRQAWRDWRKHSRVGSRNERFAANAGKLQLLPDLQLRADKGGWQAPSGISIKFRVANLRNQTTIGKNPK
jgi:hypothetical protein